MTAFLLWFLATLDSAFVGFREAAGRSALIRKAMYYQWAMLRGALFGQAAIAIAATVIVLTLLVTPDRRELYRDYLKAGDRLLDVYIPYAIVILLAFAVRLHPAVDVRSLLSVLIFGPLTLLRPVVAVAGLFWAFLHATRWQVFLVGVVVLYLMLSMERFLERFRSYMSRRAERRSIETARS